MNLSNCTQLNAQKLNVKLRICTVIFNNIYCIIYLHTSTLYLVKRKRKREKPEKNLLFHSPIEKYYFCYHRNQYSPRKYILPIQIIGEETHRKKQNYSMFCNISSIMFLVIGPSRTIFTFPLLRSTIVEATLPMASPITIASIRPSNCANTCVS